MILVFMSRQKNTLSISYRAHQECRFANRIQVFIYVSAYRSITDYSHIYITIISDFIPCLKIVTAFSYFKLVDHLIFAVRFQLLMIYITIISNLNFLFKIVNVYSFLTGWQCDFCLFKLLNLISRGGRLGIFFFFWLFNKEAIQSLQNMYEKL